MGASSPAIVCVLRLVEEEIRVFAVNLDEAEREASALPGVAHVVDSKWEPYETKEDQDDD